jgi:hypothetical protein
VGVSTGGVVGRSTLLTEHQRHAERDGLVSGDQILNLAIKGRDFLGLLSTLPGVIDTRAGSRDDVSAGRHLGRGHRFRLRFTI